MPTIVQPIPVDRAWIGAPAGTLRNPTAWRLRDGDRRDSQGEDSGFIERHSRVNRRRKTGRKINGG
jgi:hypothetical protein